MTPENDKTPIEISDEEIIKELQIAYKTMKEMETTTSYKMVKHEIEQNLLLKEKSKTNQEEE